MMEKNELEEQIEKLKQFEKDMSAFGEDEDTSFINELETMLNFLKGDGNNSNSLKVKIKKLNPNATIPSYSKEGDAGMDLVATEIISETNTDVTYGTGIAMEIPKGYVGLVFPRSSIRKYDLSLTNSVGVIDSGYRGEIQSTFKKTNWLRGNESVKYNVGDKISQIIIIPYPQIEFIETDKLSETDRGEGGFGSTGS